MSFGNNGKVIGTREWMLDRVYDYSTDVIGIEAVAGHITHEDLIDRGQVTIAIVCREAIIAPIGKKS